MRIRKLGCSSQGFSVHSLAIPVGFQLSCSSLWVLFPTPAWPGSALCHLCHLPSLPQAPSGPSPSLLGFYLCSVKTKCREKSKTPTFSPYLGIFASLTTPLLFHQLTPISLQVNTSCPSVRGWGKRGHSFPSAVSVFSVTHSSL